MKMPKYKYLFVISDILIFSIVLYFTGLAMNALTNVNINSVKAVISPAVLSIAFLLIVLLIFSLNNMYKITIVLVRSAHLTAVIRSVFFSLFIAVPAFLILTNSLSQAVTAITCFVISFLFWTYILRIEFLRRLYVLLKNKGLRRKVLIVGDGKPGRMLAAKLAFENPVGIIIVGFIDEAKEIGEEIINGKKVLGKYKDINTVVKQNQIDEILIVDETRDYEQLLELVDYCRETKIHVKITSELFKIIPQKLYTEKYENLPVIDISSSYNNSWISFKIKRGFDLAVSILAFILLSPFFVLIAVLVKISSEGPVFFSQIRVGKGGRPFKFYKFRTMIVIKEEDAERKEKMLQFMKENNSSQGETKVKSDWRITKIGRLLRKTSLDELPQLFNVIRGDMSLVGPRPCLLYEYENYDIWQKRRVNVIPGCTGVWQVIGRSKVSFKDSIVLDLYYINNMSPWMDLQLMLKTIPVILFGRGGG